MKVLLRQDVASLGVIGDVVEVSPGYARNYLLPQRVAVEPTDANVRRIEQERKERQRLHQQHIETLKGVASRLDGTSVTIKAKANELGHLFGSVTETHIAQALKDEGFDVEPDTIALAQPIRTLDKFRVPVHLAKDIDAEVEVWVVPA